MSPERKAGVVEKIGTQFDLRPHMESDRWPQIYAGIQQHLQKIYNGKKAALKERYWVPEEDGTYDLERLRRGRPSHISEVNWDAQLAFWNDPKNLARAAQNKQNRAKSKVMETSATREYPSLIHTFFLTHTVGGVFLNPEDKALYDEMLRLQGLGSNTPTGVPYTEDEIMAIVRGGKQRGHIPGVGRVLPGQGTVIPPPSQSTHSTDIARLKKREKQLTKQVNMFMRLFRSDDKFSQMLNQFESQPEYGGGSGSGGCGDDEPGDDEDGGEDEDDSIPLEYIHLGQCTCVCRYCGAMFWECEKVDSASYGKASAYNKCCYRGRTVLRPPPEYPQYIKELYNDAHFMDNIRAYNQMFSMTSLGANIDNSVNTGKGPYVFRVSGQIYHWIGSMCPDEGKPPRFLQLYICDTTNEVNNRLAHFHNNHDSKLKKEIVEGLIEFLDDHNALVQLFRTARDKYMEADIPEFKMRYSLKNGTADIVPKSSQRKKLSHEGKTKLKENLKEIEAFNSSSVCASFKRKNARIATRKEKRTRCFIWKERGHVLWKCHNKKNKNRGETWKPSFDKRLKYPERVHVKTDYMVEGSDKQNWDKIWYVGSAYKNHMSPTKSLFKRLKDNFKMLDIEEDERKFIFSYGVGEASVETKDGALVIPNVYYTPEITMNVLNVEQLENQGYVVTYERNKCGIRYMFDEGEGMIDAQGDNVMVYENSASMIESHNKFLDEYFESIDPKDECSLIKGMEDLKMEKEDVHDYIDDEYLSMNGTLYAMKFVDNLGGYMNVSLDNKWNEIAKLLGLAQENQEAVKECYKEYIGMVKIYYEEAKRSKQEKPGKEVVGDGSGTAGIKEPQAVAEMDAEIGDSLDGTQGKTAQDNVKVEGNFDWTADNNGEEYTSSSDDFIVIT
ncbi:ARID DNA-binding domain-containing protein [Tanacetum coccineum]|uniref:ARID DNA-binding domain-containing protein n=1 Tax=Tanacetum coccineum TaxID=301880 RepID=A0ABQ4Z314_9ASTR